MLPDSLQSADEVMATEWCRSFHASKNALGMLREATLRSPAGPGRAGPPAMVLRLAALRVLVAVKVGGTRHGDGP